MNIIKELENLLLFVKNQKYDQFAVKIQIEDIIKNIKEQNENNNQRKDTD